jgi:hypothetical protein
MLCVLIELEVLYILEELLLNQQPEDAIKEQILLAAWYIWWIRRQGVHDEHGSSSYDDSRYVYTGNCKE